MPKVSVIIPVYNTEKYLRECLDSVVNQTLKDIEIICVNDGSTDNSGKILDEYAAKDNRIKLITQENCGLGQTRNVGLKYVSADYIFFLDADDFIELDTLEKMYNKSHLLNLDICVCGGKNYNAQTKKYTAMNHSILKKYLPEKEVFSSLDVKDSIFHLFVGWVWDKLYKRTLIIDNNLSFPLFKNSEDTNFTYMALILSNRISTIEEPLHVYRRGISSSLSLNREVEPDAFIKALKLLKNELITRNLYEKFKTGYLSYIITFSKWHLDTISENYKDELYKKIIEFIKESINENDSQTFLEKSIENLYKSYINSRKYNDVGKNIRVSIIVPVYNVEQYIEECMESIINQTLKDIEIICVDDGSTDNSGKILDEYAAKDNRIKVIHKENGGYGKAMNVGLDNAIGEYIGIVESDDYIKPRMYEILYNKAVENNLDLIKANHYKVAKLNNKKIKYTPVILDKTNTYYNCIIDLTEEKQPYRFSMQTWAGIYKKEYLLKNNICHNETPGASYQDNGFYLKSFWYAKRAMFLNEFLYMYRTDNLNSSVNNPKKVFCAKTEFDLIRQTLEKDESFKKKFIGSYNYKKFISYMFTFNRINIKYKKLFLKTFSEEFKEAYKNKEIDESFFSKKQIDELHLIVKNPMKFCRKKLGRLSLFEKLFSIRNKDSHKEIRFLGFKLKIKSKKLIERKRINDLENKVKKLNKKIKELKEEIKKQSEIVNK